MQNYLKKKSDTLFDDSSWFKDFFQPSFFKQESVLKTDVIENPDTYTLVIDIPGCNKKDVKVSSEDGYLTIEVNQSSNHDSNSNNYIKRERMHGNYSRSYYIGNSIDTKDIYATFSNGTLYISIPKQKNTSTISYIPINEK